jgi:hypothetical protein
VSDGTFTPVLGREDVGKALKLAELGAVSRSPAAIPLRIAGTRMKR